MIEKEKLEAVAIDFADEVKLSANPLEEQISKMNKTFTNVTNNGVGEFDTTMLTTTITAKNSKTSEPETRLITSERDIEVQIDVGMYDFENEAGTERYFGLMENDLSSAENPKIYSRCPDNFLEFMTDYFTKYNRYPKINVNVNTYDASISPEGSIASAGNIIETIQGNLSAKYKSARKPMETINTELMKQLQNQPFPATAKISLGEHHKYIPEPIEEGATSPARKDALITSPNISIEFRGDETSETLAGKLVIVRSDDQKPSIVYAQTSYDMTYPYKNDSGEEVTPKYKWGISSSMETYDTWVTSNKCFGDVEFIMNKESTPRIAEGMIFHIDKKGDWISIGKLGIETAIFAGHTEEKQQYLYAIEGFMDEEYGHELDIENEATVNMTETYQDLRFKFVVEVYKGGSKPSLSTYMELSKLQHEIKWTAADNGEGEPVLPYTKGEETITKAGDDQSALTEKYMHFDESLHLPEIYFPEEPTEE